MSAVACALCAVPVADAAVCSGCSRRLELALGDVPALVADLDLVITRQTKYAGMSERVDGKAEPPVPFHIVASAVGQTFRIVLSSWCRIVWDEHYEPHAGVAGPACRACSHLTCRAIRGLPADNSAALSRWLMHDVGWMRTQRWADEAIGNLQGAIGDVRRICDAPRNRSTFYVAHCPEHACNGELHAFIPRDEPVHMTCNAEPLHTWDSTQWHRLGQRLIRLQVSV